MTDPMSRVDLVAMHQMALAAGTGDFERYRAIRSAYMRTRGLEHLVNTMTAQLVVEWRGRYGGRWQQLSELATLSADLDADMEIIIAEEQFAADYPDDEGQP